MATTKMLHLLQRRFTSTAASMSMTASESRCYRNSIFSREQARQRALYPRIEKIEVSMEGPGLDGTLLIMNKGMSTPLSCAKHFTEYHVTNSAMAMVDGEPWPLHQPLTHSCKLSLVTFKDNDPTLVNQAYWRSCAALLGQIMETAFKDKYHVELLTTPEVPVTSGAFCCDVVLDPQLDSWEPNEESLRSLTTAALKLIYQNMPWEPLEVSPSVALEVFAYSRWKQQEVEQKAANSPKGRVTLYRCGDHVLLAGGPLVAATGLCCQYDVTAIHRLEQGPWGLERRVQGLSLPLQLKAHHSIWNRLRPRAKNLVKTDGSKQDSADSAPLAASE